MAIDFHGPARPLTDNAVHIIAGYLGCHIAAVRAVLAVEAAGKGFGADGRPIILNEPHIFYRELGAGTKRNRAAAAGLAYAKWGTRPYPRTQAARYVWLSEAMKIDETAALKSCSWGMAQVMGFNYRAAGFNTVQEFVQAMTLFEDAHLYAMARFIVTNGLQKHLRALNWAGFARGYNGSGYAKNAYHTKLASAYGKRPSSERVTPKPSSLEQLNSLIGPPRPEPKPPPDDPVPVPPDDDETQGGFSASAGFGIAIIVAVAGFILLKITGVL